MFHEQGLRRDWTRSQRAQNTRAVQLRNGHGPVPVSVVVRRPVAWRQWREVTLRLEGLDSTITTFDLWKQFSVEGELVFIEIYETANGTRSGSGKLRFSPPPKEEFWAKKPGKFHLTRRDKTEYLIFMRLENERPEQKIPSPFRKHIFYRSCMELVPYRLDFGIMEEENVVAAMQRAIIKHSSDLKFSVNLRRNQIVINFAHSFVDPRSQGSKAFASSVGIGQYDRDNHYMFRIPFEQLKVIKYLDYDKFKIADFFGLIIKLDTPPTVFRKQLGSNAGHAEGSLIWSEFDTWYRQTDIDYDPYQLQTTKVSLHKHQPEIDIGRWTTYLLTFRKSTTDQALFNELKQALQDFNIEIVDAQYEINWEPSSPKLWTLIDPLMDLSTRTDFSLLEPNKVSFYLPFEVRYQLEVCISRDYFNEHNITRDFVKYLSILSHQDPIKATNILEYVAEQAKRVYDPMSIFQMPDALSYSPRTEIPHYCAFVRKATITPTTIYYSSPTVETTNRVLRHYARENQDGRFLRVQFTDEVFEGKINSTSKTSNNELFTRVYRTLYNGIQIGDRHYEFLAFGNSQFREHGAYFFCQTADLSCDDIRAWMGHFSDIKVVAKYAARLGQCFSTTRAINGLSNPKIVKIEDIERNGYCFTDGVGKISPLMAQVIATDLGLQVKTAPSAFQFRLGGCKGVLAVWPDAKEKEVHIRPSQQKFAATYNGLEIVRCAQFSCAALNRQTITILSALGVPDDVFLDMLSTQLDNYEAAMIDDDLAVSLLCRYVDETQMTINIATMIRNGFMTQRDPFVVSLLHLWRAWSIKLLKEKAKIIVENGAFVLGCVDETATLRGYTAPTPARDTGSATDGLPQIFLQIPDRFDPKKYTVIEGICLVGRNPSLHPGDLRVVEAVNIPKLHHLRNVVVFPSNGDRDVPSMCAGGDLDGDDFFVLWDERLCPQESNYEPMSYAASPPKVIKRPVKITDLMKFFVVYMKNDSLPTIAHAHLAQADFLENSVKDPKCLELAHLHSKAVDYVKSGQPATLPKHLRPRKWPHFMEKKYKSREQQYNSGTILGLLYDRVETVNFVPQWQERFDTRILRAYKLDDQQLKLARQTKSQYDTAMRRILANQDIRSEFEVWSTFVLSKPRVGSDYKFQEEVARLSDALKEQFRAVCIEKAGGRDFSILGPFVAAMYKVTKEEVDIALAECRSTKIVAGHTVPKRIMEPKSMPLISFPWLFEKELGRIATGIDPSTTHEELGQISLDYTIDKVSRRRQGGPDISLDDFIQQEDGVIIHRGEELDLFRTDVVDQLSYESSDDDHSSSAFDDLKEAGYLVNEHSSAGSANFVNSGSTGPEDIVQPAQLEGLIDSRGSKRVMPQISALPSISTPPTILTGMESLKPVQLNSQTGNISVGRPSRAEANSSGNYLEKVVSVGSSGRFPLSHVNDAENFTGEAIDVVAQETMEEQDEEVVDLPIVDSALDRLLLMQRI